MIHSQSQSQGKQVISVAFGLPASFRLSLRALGPFTHRRLGWEAENFYSRPGLVEIVIGTHLSLSYIEYLYKNLHCPTLRVEKSLGIVSL